MSLNTAHADHGVLIHAGEIIILFSDDVHTEFYGNDSVEFKGTKVGRMYLTTHRMIFNSKSVTDSLRSFSFPFIALADVLVEQPIFGANYIRGKIRAQPNGNFVGEVKFKLVFKSGGAIEFGQAMLKAAYLASRNHSGPPPPYTPPSGPWHAASPGAYAPPAQGYYGWVPPYEAFPQQPPPNSVFVSNIPPPYPGLTGTQYPPTAGFVAPNVLQEGIPSPNGNAFGPPPPGYPGAPQGGYPGAPQGGYPGAPQGGYPGGPQNGFPGASAPPGYPGGHPQAPQPQNSNDAKAAEAARSAYYDPNRPQTAYVPPPYNDQPPTYQESTSKKDN